MWVTVEVGTVKLIHHSTSSTIEMVVTDDEEVSQGVFEKVSNSFWFDYGTFPDLRDAINQTNFP